MVEQQRNNLLEVRDLKVAFPTDQGDARAVDGINLEIAQGKTHAIVGESGCGKSVTALAIMGLLHYNAKVHGSIRFEGEELFEMSQSEYRELRGGRIGMIFQEPMSALNPVMRVGEQILEGLKIHTNLNRNEAKDRVYHWISEMGLRDVSRVYRSYPHELSGGMRQRVMIAQALASQPTLLIADEPTTALDVTTQSQIMDLLLKLQENHKISILIITHDLGVVAEMAHEVSVMYAGQVVEHAPVGSLFSSPRHPYSRALFKAIPGIHNQPFETLYAIPGQVPPATEYEALGPCRFYPRCETKSKNCITGGPLCTD